MRLSIDADGIAEARRRLASEGVRHIELQVPDLDGGLRGKIVALDKALSPNGGAFCTILFGLTMADDVYASEHSSPANGYPDNLVVADPATAVVLAEEGLGAVLCDTLAPDGRLCPLSPRSVLRKAIADAAPLGFEMQFGFEYEICLMRRDEAALAAGRHHELPPPSRLHNAYSLLRPAETRVFGRLVMDRLAAVGIPVEAVHTELGHGMMEIAFGRAGPLDAADMAIRAKLMVKQLAAEAGYIASFMAKWRIGESGCGGHVHQSLWRNGEPVFANGDGGLAPEGAAYVAGLAATMADVAAILFPTVNAYRRLDAGAWAPENASWGIDNRTAALRVILGPARSAARVEHRAPGADANPYLAVAAMVAGGAHGIRAGLVPLDMASGDASHDARFTRMPRSLDAAVDLFERSAFARSAFGDAFVAHYALSRREEWRLWQAHLASQVTRWELDRYFENA